MKLLIVLALLSMNDFTFVDAEMAWTVPLIPHHQQKQRWDQRRLHRLDSNHPSPPEVKQVDALYQGYGTHYVDIWCGTPPQRQTVVVDTGSPFTAFPCRGCRDCGEAPAFHIDELFDQDVSKTFHEVMCSKEESGCMSEIGKCHAEANEQQCKLEQFYSCSEGWKAFEALDRCYLGEFRNEALDTGGETLDLLPEPLNSWDLSNPASNPFEIDKFMFGCQTEVLGLFRTQLADGILGMDAGKDSYWQQLHAVGKLPEKKFSLCFSRQPLKERERTEAGGLTLGGSDTRWHDTPMQYAKMEVDSRKWYKLKIRRILLQENDSRVAQTGLDSKYIALNLDSGTLNHGGVTVDSGTTDTYLDKGIRKAFKDAYKQLTGIEFSETFHTTLTLEEVLAMPTIVFQFEGFDNVSRSSAFGHLVDSNFFDEKHPSDIYVSFPPSHYMELTGSVEKHQDKRTYNLGLGFSGGYGTTLGANFMMGHDVEFDVDNMQMGWSESTCNYTDFVGTGILEGEKVQRVAETRRPDSNGRPGNKFSLPLGLVGPIGVVITIALVTFKKALHSNAVGVVRTETLEMTISLSQETHSLQLESFEDEI